MNYQEIYLPKLKAVGFKTVGGLPYYYEKEDIVIQVYTDSIFVERRNASNTEMLPVMAEHERFIRYNYRGIPASEIVSWICDDLSKLEIKAENYMLSNSLEVLG